MLWRGLGILTLAILLSLQYTGVYGCSCLPSVIHPQKFYCNVKMLFVGKVLSQTVDAQIKRTFRVKIGKVIKDPQNKLDQGSVVEVTTCGQSACCGINLRTGSKYLMYTLTPNLCGEPFILLDDPVESEAVIKRVKMICKCCKKCQVEVCQRKYIYTFFPSDTQEKCPLKKKKFCTYDIDDPKAQCYKKYGVCCKKKGKCRWKKTDDFTDCL